MLRFVSQFFAKPAVGCSALQIIFLKELLVF